MEVCRLCLDLVATQGDAKPLDGETRDMVQVVAPELNLEASKNPSVCSECQKTLSRLFDFKSRVFEHEGEIREKVGDRRGTVSLKAAVTGEADPPLDPDRDKAKDRLCRTCLAPIECESFTVLRPSEPDAYLSSMLDMCLVEVDLALTKDPVMCEGCLDNLQKLHHFKSSCQDVEDKIVDYCNKNKLKESTVVDLHAVLESERPRDIEMLTVKDEDGASGSKIKDEEKEVEPKSEDEDEEMSEDEEEDEEMSEDEEVKQEELDIKSETEPGTSDSDKMSSGPMVCPYNCKFTTTKKEILQKHVYLMHECIPSFSCCHCHALFRTYCTLEKHRKKCEIEQYKTKQARYQQEHEVKYQQKPEHKLPQEHEQKCQQECKQEHQRVQLFECPSCPITTSTRCDMFKHNLVTHSRQVVFQCKVCPMQDQYKCRSEEHTFNVLPLEKQNYGFQFECPSCSFRSNTKTKMVKHNRIIHRQQLVFRCRVCPMTQGQYKFHSKEHKLDVVIINQKKFCPQYECPNCPFRTAQKREIVEHNQVIHKQKVVFRCKMCPMQDQYRCQTRNHTFDVLTVEQKLNSLQYECPSCSFRTAVKHEIVKHNRIIHRQHVVFQCQVCPKQRQYKCLTKDHMCDVLTLEQKKHILNLLNERASV